jgi:hypothetical protein
MISMIFKIVVYILSGGLMKWSNCRFTNFF